MNISSSLRKRIDAFHWAAVKLSAFYVIIVMIISVIFSVAIYNISSLEVGRGMGRTFRMINECLPDRLPPGFESLERVRVTQIEEINQHLKSNLALFNLIILGISAFLSYFLAKKTLQPLQKAHELQSRFTSDASHELRTPLAAIKTQTEVALRDKHLSISEARKLLSSNIEEIDKLEGLSDTLIKLARYREIGDSFENLEISEILVEAFENVQVLADKKKIVFKNQLKSASVLGDKGSLVELFVILLDNAIKYSDAGGKIEIIVSKNNKGVEVTIRDHGDGIASEELPYIFDRFYRADSSRAKNKTNGYGLGLSLAKQIVDFHHGEISAKSTLGKGSEFLVTLS